MKETTQALEEEIKWCEEHQDVSLSDDYKKGFVKGLKQAIFLIDKIKKGE